MLESCYHLQSNTDPSNEEFLFFNSVLCSVLTFQGRANFLSQVVMNFLNSRVIPIVLP